MWHLRCAAATCATTLAAAIAIAASPPPGAPALKCDVGPAETTFGNSRWLVYSCDDNRSVVLVSAPGNPATPFVFSFMATGDSYLLRGEGRGRKETTAAAFAELRKLTGDDIATLVTQTKQQRK